MSYVLWAAALGVPLTEVEVEVQADADARGMYGIADVPAGYTEVRYRVCIASSAPVEAVIRVLDIAEAHSPYVDVFRREQRLRREVHIAGLEG
jgi:hypothetical protein